MKFVAPLAAVLLLSCLEAVSASTFVLDPTESYFTIDGTASGKPASPQAPGSLTAHLSGTLQVGQNAVDALRIGSSFIDFGEQPGTFVPFGRTADFAGQVNNYSSGRPAYFWARQSHSYLMGNLPLVGNSGQYSTDQLKMRFSSPEMVGKRPYNYYSYGEPVLKEFGMSMSGPAELSTAAGRFRIEIPIASNSISVLSNNLSIRFSGTLVGYSDIDPRLTPEVLNGSFESYYGWFDPQSSGRASVYGGFQPYEQENPQVAGFAALLASKDSPTRLVQELLGPGMLLPDTLYQLWFDVGNGIGERTEPSNDQYASADVYLSLGGVNRSGDYAAAGGIYHLEQLSDIADDSWRRGESLIFDTSYLTPEQLAQGIYLVLQATSRSHGGSEVRFANIRIAIVPEPSSLVLALCATVAGCVIARSRRRH